MRPVGILGGMGPEATVLLMQRVINAVDAKDDADHVPLIVHQNPQVPSRIRALIEGGGADPGPVLARMAQDVERAGARALAMPCNTAHHFAAAIREASTLPFLDMPALTTAALAQTGARRIGMLASPATRMTDVFDPVFERAGLELIYPEDDAAILDIIRSVKSGESRDALSLQMVEEALDLLKKSDHILIACTELSLLTGALPEGLAWTDSLDCLCRAVVEFAGSDPTD